MPTARRHRPDGPDLSLERGAARNGRFLAGIDEVGRGAWAGPLTMAAVVLDLDSVPPGLRDSKRLTPHRREALADLLHRHAEVGVGIVPVAELDRVGLGPALRLAAARAVAALPRKPDEVVVDGTVDLLEGQAVASRTLVGGADRCASVAAASIVAKVHRDAAMCRSSEDHPAYAFRHNKGYPSPAHRSALAEHGPCVLHRHSWRPIQALLAPTQPRLSLDTTTGWDPTAAGSSSTR